MNHLDGKVTTDFLISCDKMLKSIGYFVKLNSFPASIYKNRGHSAGDSLE